MEMLERYGTEQPIAEWLPGMAEGTHGSAFAMTEPDAASSDVTNIRTRIERDGDCYVINRKWWTSGAGAEHCRVLFVMGQTDPDNPSRHLRQSLVIVPKDTHGVTILRDLNILCYSDAPHGHAEVALDNVRVPVANILLGEGRGFEIAQGRLGPGRIHHAMRNIGMAERALESLCRRALDRHAFGKLLADQGVTRERIAESRIRINQARLLVLNAAHRIDTVGAQAARMEIAAIKVAAPLMLVQVVDWAISASAMPMPARGSCATSMAPRKSTGTQSPEWNWQSTAEAGEMSMSAAPQDAILVEVLPNHRFDEAALAAFLSGLLPGVEHGLVVRQFQGGQSNPTYHLQAGDDAYVLRKQPSGPLLPGAHAIDREFHIQSALAGKSIPLATMHLLCMEDSPIGQPFYVMDHVEGRIFADRLLPGVEPIDRRRIYLAMVEVLAKIHNVDVGTARLATFGKRGGCVTQQISRWQRAYESTKVDDNADMEQVICWLLAHIPAQEQETIVHGDFRIGNLIIHPSSPEIAAVLDWELATIGHPLADLAYTCMAYHLSSQTQRGFSDVDLAALGIPAEHELVRHYAALRGLDDIPDWDYFVVFDIPTRCHSRRRLSPRTGRKRCRRTREGRERHLPPAGRPCPRDDPTRGQKSRGRCRCSITRPLYAVGRPRIGTANKWSSTLQRAALNRT